MSTQTNPPPAIRKGDWIRFQVNSNRIVLEGFVQEIARDGRIRVGRALQPLEERWYSLSEISIIKTQRR